jgi:hypothetical protein
MPHLTDANFCRVVGLPVQAPPSPESAKNKNDKTDLPAESNSVTSFVSSVASGLWSTIASKKDEEGPEPLEKKKKDDKKQGDKKRGDDDDDDDAKTNKAKKTKTIPGSFSALPAGASPPVVTPQKPKYFLHRDIFYLRETTFKKKQQKKQAAERLMNLDFPAVPKSAPT